MGALFKTTCGVFWIIWMCVISTYFGFDHIQRMFTYEQTSSPAIKLMTIACIMTMITAVWGCCCVKLDVTNLCCACFYLVGFALSTLIICIVLLLYIQTASSSQHQSQFEVLGRVKDLLGSKGKIPHFLHNVQIQFRCCGVAGFKDYRALLLETQFKEDVPYSCCKNQSLFYKRTCSSNKDPKPIEGIYLDVEGFPIQFPSKDQYKMITQDLYGTFEQFGPPPQRYLSGKLKLPVNVSKVQNINLKGCYEYLKTNTDTMYNSYTEFTICLMAFVSLMGGMFARNCFRGRKAKMDGKSDEITDEDLTALSPIVQRQNNDHDDDDVQSILEGLSQPKKKLTIQENGGTNEGRNIVKVEPL